MGPSLDLSSLVVPEQQPAENGTFDVRPKAVNAWIESLPMANLGETSTIFILLAIAFVAGFVLDLISIVLIIIPVAIETTCHVDTPFFLDALELVDWMFIDIKHMDPKGHFRLTGKNNELILNNVRLASATMAAKNRVLVIRTVIVPGMNDGSNIHELAEFLHSLPYIENVELLPYHAYGTYKYDLLHRSYDLINSRPPNPELMEKCRRIFAKHDISAFWKDTNNLQVINLDKG